MRRPALVLVLVLMAACKRAPPEAQGRSARPRPSAAASPSGAASAEVAAVPRQSTTATASTPTGPSAKVAFAHCKAVGKLGQVRITTLHEPVIELRAERDYVLAFTYAEPLARVTLHRIRRDGSSTEVVGRHTAAGEPASPVLSADAAYGRRRMPLHGAAAENGGGAVRPESSIARMSRAAAGNVRTSAIRSGVVS
jgi:hypothetical protein